MVTSGTCRQSSRGAGVAGPPASASARGAWRGTSGLGQARVAAGLHRAQIAVFRLRGRARRNAELLAEHLLVDRLQPAAAVRGVAENRHDAVVGVIGDFV